MSAADRDERRAAEFLIRVSYTSDAGVAAAGARRSFPLLKPSAVQHQPRGISRAQY